MAVRAAERLVLLSSEPKRDSIAIALSGGNTPKLLYGLLGNEPFRQQVRWQRLEFFFGDERAVPPDHPDSNYGMVRRALSAEGLAKIHPMKADTGDSAAYQELLRRRVATSRRGIPLFDLILLGIGRDGHTASLFPGTAALEERENWVVMNEVPQLGTRRMTFTYPLLNEARLVWVLAPGREKKEIVKECLAARSLEGSEERWPVLGVRPEAGELIWWLDRDSAPGHLL